MIFLVILIAAAGFSPPDVFSAHRMDPAVGMNSPRFCPPLPDPTGTVINISTVAALVAAVNNAAAGTTILLADWNLAVSGETPSKIAPL